MMTGTPLPPTPKPRRRWLQFTLRTLFIMVLACSLPCAWIAERMNRTQRQRETVHLVRDLGGYVRYDSERWPAVMAPKVALITPSFR